MENALLYMAGIIIISILVYTWIWAMQKDD